MPTYGNIPNIANNKMSVGITYYALQNLSTHIGLNYVDIRRTIATNPEKQFSVMECGKQMFGGKMHFGLMECIYNLKSLTQRTSNSLILEFVSHQVVNIQLCIRLKKEISGSHSDISSKKILVI